MKLLMISAIAAVTLLASAATVLRSQSALRPVPSAGAFSLQTVQAAIDVNRLPIEHFDDQSSVYSAAVKQ